MQFKLVPEAPPSLDRVAEAHAAVPLVPGSEDDCCARLMRRVGFRSRDVARTWLTFLRAVGLAEETPDGFKRLRENPTPDLLRERLFEGVYGASDTADALLASEDTLGTDDAFAAFADRVPNWERYRTDDWESVWRERVERHLEWFVLLDLAEAVDGGYRATDRLRAVRADGAERGSTDDDA